MASRRETSAVTGQLLLVHDRLFSLVGNGTLHTFCEGDLLLVLSIEGTTVSVWSRIGYSYTHERNIRTSTEVIG
jgi:hypothetical protein